MNAAQRENFFRKRHLKNRAGITKAVMETLEENGVLRDLSDTESNRIFRYALVIYLNNKLLQKYN